jgi:hypothetical protein
MPNPVVRAEYVSRSFVEKLVHGFEEGNVLGVGDVMERHSGFMDDLHDYADEMGWEYSERSPEIELWRDGQEREPVIPAPDSGKLKSYGLKKSEYQSRWSPDIEGEFGPIQDITLIYQSDTPNRHRAEAIGAEINLSDNAEERIEEDITQIMEQHYGDEQDFPIYNATSGAML